MSGRRDRQANRRARDRAHARTGVARDAEPAAAAAEQLMCPSCARRSPSSERFCPACGMPLIYPPDRRHEATPRQRRARKIKPQYTEGELVRVARAENQIQAEFIEGLLLEEGIPCVLSSLIAGYAPLVGTRDVLVPSSAAEAAREALAWEGRAPGDT